MHPGNAVPRASDVSTNRLAGSLRVVGELARTATQGTRRRQVVQDLVQLGARRLECLVIPLFLRVLNALAQLICPAVKFPSRLCVQHIFAVSGSLGVQTALF